MMSFGLGLGGRTAKASSAFDPSSLALSLWVRTAYGGSPWDGRASAGASDTNPLIAGTAPAVGATLGGLATADYNGSTHYLVGTDNTATMLGTTAWSFAALVNPDVLAADAGTSANEAIFSDDQGLVGVEVYDSGTRVFQFDSSVTPYTDTAAALSTSTWSLVQARWTGTTIQIRINSGSWSAGTAVASLTNLTSAAWFGRNYAAAYFNGKHAELLAAANVSWSDGQFDQIKSYMNTRYTLSL